MAQVKSGYFTDGRFCRRKSGSYFELCLKAEDGSKTIVHDYFTYDFHAKPLSEAAEDAMEHLGPWERRFTPQGPADVLLISAEPFDRAAVRESIRQIPHRKRFYGAEYPFMLFYLAKRFPPYAGLTTEHGLQQITLPYSLHLRTVAFDTETEGLATIEKGGIEDKEVLCIGMATVGSADTRVYGPPEPNMIENFFHQIPDIDMIISMNGDNYDWPNLFSRVERHGIKINSMVSRKRIGRSKVSMYKIFGQQNIDLYPWVSRIYDTPTGSQDDAIRVFLGEEPFYMEKSSLKGLAEAEVLDLVKRDAENLASICKYIGIPRALVELATEFGIFSDMLMRMTSPDIANHFVQVHAYRHQGVLSDKSAVIQMTHELPFEGVAQFGIKKFEYPPKQQTYAIGYHRGPLYKVDKKILYPRIIREKSDEFRRANALPIVWAAERIEDLVKRNSSDGKPSPRTTISKFSKEVGFHLPQLVADRRYPWFNRYLWQTIETAAQPYMQGGLWNDWEYMFTRDVPDFANNSDVEKIDGLVVFDGGYVYFKNGLPFARGIKISDSTRYIADSLRIILAATASDGKEGLVKTFRERTDRRVMEREREKLRPRYSAARERKVRMMEELGLQVKDTGIDYEFYVQNLANRLDSIARVFGMDAKSLLHAAQPQQLMLIA